MTLIPRRIDIFRGSVYRGDDDNVIQPKPFQCKGFYLFAPARDQGERRVKTEEWNVAADTGGDIDERPAGKPQPPGTAERVKRCSGVA